MNPVGITALDALDLLVVGMQVARVPVRGDRLMERG